MTPSRKTAPGFRAALLLVLITAGSVGWASSSVALSSFPSGYDNDIRRAVKTYWPDLPFWKLWKAQLYQESRLDPSVCSSVGACGLGQFMPATFEDITRQIGDAGASRFDARVSIDAGAFYMHGLRREWSGRGRPVLDAHDLGEASYNAGLKSILLAQQACGDALLWDGIAPCLESVTGAAHAKETLGYVSRIRAIWKLMESE